MRLSVKVCWTLCVCLSLTSCNCKLTYKQAIIRSYGKTIDFSWNKLYFQKDTLVSYQLLPDVPIRIVSYIDNTLCDQCLVKYLWGVERLMQKFDTDSVRFVALLASRPKEQILNTLRDFNPVSCEIILDVDDSFIPYNGLERYPAFCRVFLVDVNNRIILTGDPLRHSDLQKLYIAKIEKLISRGGGIMRNGLFLLCVSAICAHDIIMGSLQLYGLSQPNHYLFGLTGSFDNPGPYGGFLAVCISILGAWIFSVKVAEKEGIIRKLLYWVVSATVFSATVLLPSTQSRSALLGLGCSAILFATRNEGLRSMLIPIIRRYSWLICLGVLFLGTGVYLFKKPSADGRLFMDRISIMTIWNDGLKGVGHGHFGGAYGETQSRYFQNQIRENGKDDLDWTAINEHERMTAECPDNAFNEYLFIGVENGLLAMLLFCGIIVVSIVISYRNDSVWCYGLVCFAVFALFSYPLHVWQFQILFPILVTACLLSVDKSDRKSFAISITTLTVFLGCLSWTLLTRLPYVQQSKGVEKKWKKAERWHTMEYYEYVVEDCEPLLPYMKHDRKFLFAYGQSLNKTGQYEKSDSILSLGTQISSDPMFWNVMGNNSLALGRYHEAEERYKHAFYMVPNRLYPLTLLARLYHEEGDTARFLDMADKVEKFVPKIESVNTERLRDEIKVISNGYTNNKNWKNE